MLQINLTTSTSKPLILPSPDALSFPERWVADRFGVTSNVARLICTLASLGQGDA
jgi:hypothetical protein